MAAVLLLAACAGQAPPPPADAQATAQATAPGGDWVVTDVWGGSSRDPAGMERLVGQTVRLDANGAGDILGRVCDAPAWREGETTEAAFLGAMDRVHEFPALRRPLTVIEARCDGQPFGRYARWHDGSLMARLGHTVLRLVPAAAVIRATPAPTVAPPTPAPAERLVYLASYRNAKEVEKGWRELTAHSPTLAGLSQVTRTITLPRKGTWLRLFAAAHDDAEARKLCGELGKEVPDCDVDHGMGRKPRR
jgi:hypothetical protein